MAISFVNATLYELPVRLVLSQITWMQSLHTNGGTRLSVTAKAFHSNLVVRRGESVRDLKFEITFVRGDIDGKLKEIPPDACGYLSYHPDRLPAGVVKGQCSIPDDVYDEVWHRLKAASDLVESLVTINAGPVHAFAGDDVVWNNDNNEPLFVADAEFSFIRKERSKEVD
jgi:hypothetical protein